MQLRSQPSPVVGSQTPLSAVAPPQRLLNGRYRKITKMGQGAYGAVYLAEDMRPTAQSQQLSPDSLPDLGKPASQKEV